MTTTTDISSATKISIFYNEIMNLLGLKQNKRVVETEFISMRLILNYMSWCPSIKRRSDGNSVGLFSFGIADLTKRAGALPLELNTARRSCQFKVFFNLSYCVKTWELRVTDLFFKAFRSLSNYTCGRNWIIGSSNLNTSNQFPSSFHRRNLDLFLCYKLVLTL